MAQVEAWGSSVLFPFCMRQGLEQCQAQSGHLVLICCINEWIRFEMAPGTLLYPVSCLMNTTVEKLTKLEEPLIVDESMSGSQ